MEHTPILKNRILFSILFVIAYIILSTLVANSFSIKIIYLVLGLSFGILVSFNYYLILNILVISVFTPYLYSIHTAVVFALFLLLAWFLNSDYDNKKLTKNCLLIPLCIYLFSISFSILNAPKTIQYLIELSNLIAFILPIIFIPKFIKNRKRIEQIINIFIISILIHSFFVIYNGLITKERAFGYLWVYYIDLAGLGILYSTIKTIFSKGLRRLVFLFMAFIILFGLILTQTRNAWLSTVVTAIFLLIFIALRGNRLLINRRVVLVLSLVSVISMLSLFFFISEDLNIDISNRLNEKTQEVKISDNPYAYESNSLVTRLFIWHTAVNAFYAEPVLGIGYNAFQYTSNKYYTIPKVLFKKYVEHLNPHLGYLKIIVETGIIGLIGFLLFFIAVIKLVFKSIRFAKNKEEIRQSLTLLISIIYISFSMMMTDAWLYGQYIVWFGIVLGLIVANYNMLHPENTLLK